MAYDQNSKADTVFLGTSTLGYEVDISQFETDLTAGGMAWLSTDNRFDVESPREITVGFDCNNTNSGMLVYYGLTDFSAWSYGIRISGGQAIIYFNDDVLDAIDLPGVDGSDRQFSLQWSTTEDPVSGSYLSEISIVNAGTLAWTIKRYTHSAPVGDNGYRFVVNGYDSLDSLPYDSTIIYVRIGRRFHSSTEHKEDWVSLTSAPDPAGAYVAPECFPWMEDPFTASNSEDVGEALANNYSFAGPAAFVGLFEGYQNRLRLYAPIVNQATKNPVALDRLLTPLDRHTTAPDGSGYVLSIYYLWRRPIPQLVQYAKVRAFVQTWIDLGAPMTSTVSVAMRMYSFDRLPHEAGVQYSVSATATRTTDDTSTGLGAWLDLGTVAIRKCAGDSDHTILALAWRMEPAIGGDYNRARVKHVVVEPLAAEG